MKNLLLGFLLLSILSCQENSREDPLEVSEAKKESLSVQPKNEVIITVDDSIQSFFTNLFLDEMQDKPDMLYLGKKDGKTLVSIPTLNKINIKGGDPSISFFYQLELEKGDSLVIGTQKVRVNSSLQIDYPIFSIAGKQWSELNFAYLLYKYNLDHQAIVIDPSRKFLNNKYDAKMVFQNALQLLDSLRASNNISEDFYNAQQLKYKFQFATYKLRKAKNQKKELDLEPLQIALNDKALLANNEYVNFLRAMILYKYFKTGRRVLNSVQFDFIKDNKTFLEEDTKLVLLDAYLKSIFFVEQSKYEAYLEKFNAINTNEALKSKWQTLAEKQQLDKEKLNSADQTLSVLSNLVNDQERTFAEVLAAHKGKIVLVDFWASWCAPCRKEMPSLNALKDKFSKADFKVIEIAIDKDYSAWVRASKLENLATEESNYLIANWENSSLYKDYKIISIPRYLLFGKDGKIINADAPRPSEMELEALILSKL